MLTGTAELPRVSILLSETGIKSESLFFWNPSALKLSIDRQVIPTMSTRCPDSGESILSTLKGETAEQIFQNAKALAVLGDLKLPVAGLEHIVALKVFAMKNDPKRALREMADIQQLLHLTGLNPRLVRRYFEKYDQLERYYAITGEKPDENEP